ncbi:MFS general substrate transporter, partial [Linderina pennispora]
LKSTLKKELHINNTQWSSVISMVWTVSSITPFIAGLVVDSLGAPLAGALSVFLILAGNGVCAIAVATHRLNIFLLGRAIYSVGGGAVLLVGEVIMLKWFKGRALPIAYGVSSTISSIMSFSGPATVTAILTNHAKTAIPFWIATGLSAFGLLCLLPFNDSESDIPPPSMSESQKHGLLGRWWQRTKELFLGLSALPESYWHMLLCVSIQGTLFIPLHEIVPEMMETEWGYTKAKASKLFVYLHVIPIVLHVITGVVINRYGHRINIFCLGSVLVFMAAIFIRFIRKVPIILSLILMNISGSLVPASIFSLMNIVIDNGEIAGAALGLIRSAEFASVTLMEMLDGLLQDADHNRYDTVLIGLVVFAAFLLVVAVASVCHDYLKN